MCSLLLTVINLVKYTPNLYESSPVLNVHLIEFFINIRCYGNPKYTGIVRSCNILTFKLSNDVCAPLF